MNVITTGPVSEEQALLSASEVETAIMEMANGKRQPGKLPVEAMARLIQFARAAAARHAATIDQAKVPKGYAIVPLVMNREMQDVTDQEGWQWRDVLAAAGTVTVADCELAGEAGAADEPAVACQWEALSENADERRMFDHSTEVFGDVRVCIANALSMFALASPGGSYGQQCRIMANEVAKLYLAPTDVAATPSSKWHANGEADPHAGHYDGERAALTLGTMTDDELANGAFLNYDQRLTLAEMRDPKPGQHMPVAWMTGVKDRIRWLSRSLERALVASRAARERADLTNERIMALWDACSTPSEENGHTTGPVPFARALLALPAEAASDSRDIAQIPAALSAEAHMPETEAPHAASWQEVPEGFMLVLVPDGVAPDEPDWDKCKYQAEKATGQKIEPITYSVLQREIRRWIAHRARRPLAHSGLLDELESASLKVLSTELGEMACTGSHAPCEDALGRLADALAIRKRAVFAMPREKRERMAYYEVQMKDPATHAALALEIAFLSHEHDERSLQRWVETGSLGAGSPRPVVGEKESGASNASGDEAKERK